ncbi:PH domain-containing protein [Streptomyces diastatochromogenes]|nr:PH domain-containing protein [Streptomyces diastatochromogenes]
MAAARPADPARRGRRPLRGGGGAALPAVAFLSGGRPLWQAVAWVLAGALLLVLAGTAADWVRLRRTRYRVGPARVDLHTGLLLLKRRSWPGADPQRRPHRQPLQRLLGLVKVRIGTGEHTGGESTLELDLVTRAEGERLRRELLAGTAGPGEPGPDSALATLDPRWIRYAPSPSSPPPSAARRSAAPCRSATGSAPRGRSSTG